MYRKTAIAIIATFTLLFTQSLAYAESEQETAISELTAAKQAADTAYAAYQTAKEAYESPINEYNSALTAYEKAVAKFNSCVDGIAYMDTEKYDSIYTAKKNLEKTLKTVKKAGVTETSTAQDVSEILESYAQAEQDYQDVLAAYRQIGIDFLNERCGGKLTVDYLTQLCLENEVLSPYMNDDFYEALGTAFEPDNMLKSVEVMHQYSELRESIGMETGNIDYPIVMTSAFGAAFHLTEGSLHVFVKQLDGSTQMRNNGMYGVSENLYYGSQSALPDNPYNLWYYQEKKQYDDSIAKGEEPERDKVGHYLILLEPYNMTGISIAFCNGHAAYSQEFSKREGGVTLPEYQADLESYISGKTTREDVDSAYEQVTVKKNLKKHLKNINAYETEISMLGSDNSNISLVQTYKDMVKAKARLTAAQEAISPEILTEKQTAMENAYAEYETALKSLEETESLYDEYRQDITQAEIKEIKSREYTGTKIMPQPKITLLGEEIPVSMCDVNWKNNKLVGTAEVIVTGRGIYKGSISRSFKILPGGTTIKNLIPKGKAFKIAWKKQKTQTTGYQIKYSLRSNFKSGKTKRISSNTTLQKTVKKLKSGKKYYVKIRTYKTVDGKNYYSPWSAKKTVKTK